MKNVMVNGMELWLNLRIDIDKLDTWNIKVGDPGFWSKTMQPLQPLHCSVGVDIENQHTSPIVVLTKPRLQTFENESVIVNLTC